MAKTITHYGLFTEDGLDGIHGTLSVANQEAKWLERVAGCKVRKVYCTGAEAGDFLDALDEVVRLSNSLPGPKLIAKTLLKFPTVTIVKG